MSIFQILVIINSRSNVPPCDGTEWKECRVLPRSPGRTGTAPGAGGPLPPAGAGPGGPTVGMWSDRGGPGRPPQGWSGYTPLPPENTQDRVSQVEWWGVGGTWFENVNVMKNSTTLLFWHNLANGGGAHPLSDFCDVLSVLPAGKHVGEGERLQTSVDQVRFRRLLLILFCRYRNIVKHCDNRSFFYNFNMVLERYISLNVHIFSISFLSFLPLTVDRQDSERKIRINLMSSNGTNWLTWLLYCLLHKTN